MLDIPAAEVVRKGRLQPGKLFVVDLDQGRIVPDDEVKREVATRKPYAAWFGASTCSSPTCRGRRRASRPSRCAGCSSPSATRRRT